MSDMPVCCSGIYVFIKVTARRDVVSWLAAIADNDLVHARLVGDAGDRSGMHIRKWLRASMYVNVAQVIRGSEN